MAGNSSSRAPFPQVPESRPLNWAALNNRVDAIRVLVAAGASVDSTNLTGFTALHHAAEAGSLEAAQALLAAVETLHVAGGFLQKLTWPPVQCVTSPPLA